jgi:hypothetical protein
MGSYAERYRQDRAGHQAVVDAALKGATFYEARCGEPMQEYTASWVQKNLDRIRMLDLLIAENE